MNNSDNLMIDPSLILANNSYESTISNIKSILDQNENIQLYIPYTFKTLLLDEPDRILQKDNLIHSFYLGNTTPINSHELDKFSTEFNELLKGFRVIPEHSEKYEDIYSSLRRYLVGDHDYENKYYHELIYNIHIEEWAFLQEKSWITSRIKKPFNKMINAGALCMHFGEKTVDNITRKSLKKDDNYIIGNVDRFRALGKWIAVGGPSILPFFNTIASVFGGMISGYFLLFDPEQK